VGADAGRQGLALPLLSVLIRRGWAAAPNPFLIPGGTDLPRQWTMFSMCSAEPIPNSATLTISKTGPAWVPTARVLAGQFGMPKASRLRLTHPLIFDCRYAFHVRRIHRRGWKATIGAQLRLWFVPPPPPNRPLRGAGGLRFSNRSHDFRMFQVLDNGLFWKYRPSAEHAVFVNPRLLDELPHVVKNLEMDGRTSSTW